MDQIEQSLLENALGPSEVQGDAGRVKQQPLADQIATDRYLESKKATRKKGLGIPLRKLVPPGTD